MKDTLTFYTNPMSRGRIVRWMLEEIGAEYKTEIIEYGAPMKTPEYLKINPMGKVPAIEHGGTVVTETAAICAYLADAFPEANLAPPINRRGAYYRWFFFAAGPIESAVTNASMGFELPEDKKGMAGYGSLEMVTDTLESILSQTDYIAGAEFTAADIYLGSHLGWGMKFGTIKPRPVFEQYFKRISARPAWVRANSIDENLMPGNNS